MAILLNIVAVVFGILAFLFGPSAPKRMMTCGVLAAVLFIVSIGVRPNAKWATTSECERYSSLADDC